VSTSVLLTPAPGWYPDPAGQAEYRWWDGDTWTAGTHAGDVAPATAATTSAVATPAEPRAPIQLFAEPEPEYAPEPAPAPAPAAAAAPAPAFAPAFTQPEPVAQRPAQPRAPRGARPAKTRWSSLLLAFPFLYPFAVGMVVALAYAGGAASNPMALIVIGSVVAVALLVPAWVFADYDRRELIARGYEPVPSLGWMALVPPIAYLIARRRVVGPSY
jgi:hypothetical protein